MGKIKNWSRHNAEDNLPDTHYAWIHDQADVMLIIDNSYEEGRKIYNIELYSPRNALNLGSTTKSEMHQEDMGLEEARQMAVRWMENHTTVESLQEVNGIQVL